jgi:hypothetical protein
MDDPSGGGTSDDGTNSSLAMSGGSGDNGDGATGGSCSPTTTQAACDNLTMMCGDNPDSQALCYCAAACDCALACDMSCVTQNEASATMLGGACSF